MIPHDHLCERKHPKRPWTGYNPRGVLACLCHARAWEKKRKKPKKSSHQ